MVPAPIRSSFNLDDFRAPPLDLKVSFGASSVSLSQLEGLYLRRLYWDRQIDAIFVNYRAQEIVTRRITDDIIFTLPLGLEVIDGEFAHGC